jgi:hypothetical protein
MSFGQDMATPMKNKVATLSPDTHRIASKMENFSGWLRARLRQFDEGVDLVELEMAKDYLRLQFKTISAVVELLYPEHNDAIWERFNIMMAQKKLGDFE